jgi:hypothetical protein
MNRNSLRRVLRASAVGFFAICFSIWLGIAGAEQLQTTGLEAVPDTTYRELNGIDKDWHRAIRQRSGTQPVTSSLSDLKVKYDLAPRSHDCPVYFGQANIQFQFSGSGKFRMATLDDIAAKLKSGDLSVDEVPIQFVWVNGKRVTVNNRSLTALYKAGKRPTKLIDQSNNLPPQGSESLESVLRRLEAMGGKPSTEMLVRKPGTGSDGRPRQAKDWDAPIGEIVSMPEDVLADAKTCERGAGK